MPNLVLLPGLACDERIWQAQLPALPPAFSARVSDAQLHNDSIEGMAAAVLRDNDGPLVLCGASMGGMVAMEAARQAPERIAGLALLGTSARPETPDMFTLREGAIAYFERGEVRDVIEPNVYFAFHPTQAADPVMIERYLDIVLGAGAEQLIRQNRAVMRRPDARQHLPLLRAPVLLMCGDSDRLAAPECTREMAALLPRSETVWVAECGHMLTMEKPDQVNAALNAWLGREFPAP
ncbi:alpha/beta fold hydrolase [Variovorax sp. OK605]|uniref:alpha/beta fold hydrolase n=1 Tax=Variovorax sp. OK605 TaxID=1855317 RepID=UPI000B894F1D|nr:alpha/beta hydrolase [Variovorax sp. OK605]